MKKCQNPKCDAIIEGFKSAKRKYCNDRCKNRAAYIKRQEEEADQIAFDKAIKRNYKILKKLKSLGLNNLSEQTLESHEFNIDALHKDVYTRYKGQMIIASCIHDIKFRLNENKELEFIN